MHFVAIGYALAALSAICFAYALVSGVTNRWSARSGLRKIP